MPAEREKERKGSQLKGKEASKKEKEIGRKEWEDNKDSGKETGRKRGHQKGKEVRGKGKEASVKKLMPGEGRVQRKG